MDDAWDDWELEQIQHLVEWLEEHRLELECDGNGGPEILAAFRQAGYSRAVSVAVLIRTGYLKIRRFRQNPDGTLRVTWSW